MTVINQNKLQKFKILFQHFVPLTFIFPFKFFSAVKSYKLILTAFN